MALRSLLSFLGGYRVRPCLGFAFGVPTVPKVLALWLWCFVLAGFWGDVLDTRS